MTRPGASIRRRVHGPLLDPDVSMGVVRRGLIILAASAAVLLPAASASADRFLTPASHDFGQLALGATSAPKDFTLRVICRTDTLGNCMSFDPTLPDVSVTGDFSQTNTCPKPTDPAPFMP